MIDEKLFKRIASLTLIAILFILTFLILKPIFSSVIFALILAFMFHPVYNKILPYIKNKNLSALLICVAIIIIIILPLWFLIPQLIKQIFEIYLYLQRVDLFLMLQNSFPQFFSAPEVSQDTITAINSFIHNFLSSVLGEFTDFLLNSPTILLHLFLILFIFFFGLRDGDKLVKYFQTLSPLSKESEQKVFNQFEEVTKAVVFGHVVTGVVQGLITGIGLYIFGVPNALTLTFVAIFISMFPIIGPWLVWVPVDIYLLTAGRTGAAIGLLVYGLIIVSLSDNIIRPLIISKKTKINSAIILVSMVGGLFVFGILGLILGPLVVAYLLLLLELYRDKKSPGLLKFDSKV